MAALFSSFTRHGPGLRVLSAYGHEVPPGEVTDLSAAETQTDLQNLILCRCGSPCRRPTTKSVKPISTSSRWQRRSGARGMTTRCSAARCTLDGDDGQVPPDGPGDKNAEG